MSDSEIARQVQERAAALLPPESDGPQLPPEVDEDLVRDCLNANERGDGVLYAALNRGKYIYNTTPKDGEWMRWAGHVWETDESRDAVDAVELCALQYEQQAMALETEIHEQGLVKERGKETPRQITMAAKFRARVDRLRGENGAKKALFWAPIVDRSMVCRESDMDRYPMLLPCANGVIDLEKGVLTRGVPGDLLTMAIDVPFDPHADYKEWCDIVTEISGSEEMAEFTQRSLGYAITGNSWEQHIWVYLGGGRNGKGILFGCVGNVMGPYYHVITPAMLMEQKIDPPAAAASEHKYSLRGKRLVVGAETKKGRRIDGGQVKMLTGDDDINCRPNFGREIVFAPSHSLFLHTNHMPIGLAGDFALVQRLLKIDFPWAYVDDPAAEAKKNPAMADRFRKKDPRLKEKLLANRPAILRWLVEGCLKWQQYGISPPAQVREGVDELAREENYMEEFFADCLVDFRDDPGTRLRSKTVTAALQWWLSNNRVSDTKRMPDIKAVNKFLRETRGCAVEKRSGVYWVLGVAFNLDVAPEIDDYIKRNNLA